MALRYQYIRDQTGIWLVIDTKINPQRVICSCTGWYANPDFICEALNAFDLRLNMLLESANVSINSR